jgi:hypothetical protein
VIARLVVARLVVVIVSVVVAQLHLKCQLSAAAVEELSMPHSPRAPHMHG